MKIEINNQKFNSLLEASKKTGITIESLRQLVKNGSKKLKRRSDQKIFHLKYDIFNQTEIIVDDQKFKNITQAAKAFDLKNYNLQYALATGKTQITRKSDGKVFEIGMKKILNKNIQRKINEIKASFNDLKIEEFFQNPKLDYCPPGEYENFCERYKEYCGEDYENPEYQPTFDPPACNKTLKNYTLNADY